MVLQEKGITLVTGLWDLKRGELSGNWKRNFSDYLDRFKELLEVQYNLIIYISKEHEDFVWQHRSRENTLVIIREKEWFRDDFPFYNKVQEIRTQKDWYLQVGWLENSTQAKMEYYNPMMFSKVFLVNDARILDPFESSYMFWIDAGITSTVHNGYFINDKTIEKNLPLFDRLTYVRFPYDGKVEVHGFKYKELCEYADEEVNEVCRGGFWGGKKECIEELNYIYYHLLNETLDRGLMGTDESIFTIISYKHKDLVNTYKINSDGLLPTFFEGLKSGEVLKNDKKLSTDKVGLYIITYNAPKQLLQLLFTLENYDIDFIKKTKIIVLNNSTDKGFTEDYDRICEQYNIEQIKKDNLGISRGRQFIAEDFDSRDDLDFMFFFEDDMFMYIGDEDVCKSGFRRKQKDLFKLSLEILVKENFDFLKLSFSEFFSSNNIQCAWHNIPKEKKIEYFGELTKPPLTYFRNIKSHKTLPYITGDIYYSNWPQVLSKKGNKKMFLKLKWEYPAEQTWMSHFYTMTVAKIINPGLLLLSPIEHNRFQFYQERKEN